MSVIYAIVITKKKKRLKRNTVNVYKELQGYNILYGINDPFSWEQGNGKGQQHS